MEVLAGLAPATMLPKGPADYETAASLHRACRQAGGTVRKLIDCLVGAVAIRDGVPILHADADFDMLASTPASGSIQSASDRTGRRSESSGEII